MHTCDVLALTSRQTWGTYLHEKLKQVQIVGLLSAVSAQKSVDGRFQEERVIDGI